MLRALWSSTTWASQVRCCGWLVGEALGAVAVSLPSCKAALPECGCGCPIHNEAILHTTNSSCSVDKALIQSIDRLGMTVVCERGKDALKCRLPFPRPAADRKDIKTLIVEMTQASAGAFA